MKNAILLLFLGAILCLNTAARRRSENVVLITLDGARGQEIFGGMDVELYRKIDADAGKKEVFKTFFAETPAQRRDHLPLLGLRLPRTKPERRKSDCRSSA